MVQILSQEILLALCLFQFGDINKDTLDPGGATFIGNHTDQVLNPSPAAVGRAQPVFQNMILAGFRMCAAGTDNLVLFVRVQKLLPEIRPGHPGFLAVAQNRFHFRADIAESESACVRLPKDGVQHGVPALHCHPFRPITLSNLSLPGQLHDLYPEGFERLDGIEKFVDINRFGDIGVGVVLIGTADICIR